MTSSVIIACYNGAKYIEEQLDSIKSQTKKVDELIICDDCSNDNTVITIKNYLKRNKLNNWTLIENSKNMGWKANFAKLTLLATKDVIFYCDQDDVWKSNKIELMLNVMDENSDIKLLVSDLNVKYMSENTQEYKPISLGNKYFQHIKQKPQWLRIMRPGCVFAVQREFAQECFKNNWRDGLAHDLLLWQYAFCRDSIGYIKEPLIEWRRFESSTTSGKILSKAEFRVIENSIFIESLEAALIGIEKYDKSVRRSYTLEKKRQNFFATKNFLIWLECLKYIDCYPKKRSWLADYRDTRK